MAKTARKKLTEAQVRAHKTYYEKNREEIIRKQVIANKRNRTRAREARLRLREQRVEQWKEIGWIVAKMNIHANLSQEAIYDLLGGLVTKHQIRFWCSAGKRLAKLDQNPISPCLSTSQISAVLLPKNL